jgi:type IV conjugative transfer system protein TraL
MSEYDKHVVLSSLDNKKRILVFTIPEVLIMVVPILIGILVGGLVGVAIMLSGFWIRKIYNRYTKRFPNSLLGGIFYWYFPSTGKKRSTLPESHVKEYIS